MSKHFSQILLAGLMLSVSAFKAEAGPVDFGIRNGVLSFEEGTSPVSARSKSQLGISSLHNKLGEKSLEWSWKGRNASISIDGEIPYLRENPDPKETSVSTFVFWVYSERPLSGNLRFSFLKQGRECCHFDYGLGFTGWRGAWVAFDRDMEGTPEEGMDQVIVSAPSGEKSGRLFFDGIITSSFQDVRHHTPDWQAPFINKETTNHWLVLNNSWKKELDIREEPLGERSEADFRTVRERFIHLVSDGKKIPGIKKLRDIYKSYGLDRNPDGSPRGKPIFFTRYGETFINCGIPDASKQFAANGQLLRAYNDNLLSIALAWNASEDSSEKEELARMYLAMTEHILDQGFAAGSGQGTLHHLGYSMRNFYTAPVIMRDVLADAGLLSQVQQAMEWFSGVGEVKTAPQEDGMDIDAFNTSLMGRVASLLMLEDSPHKQAYMKALSRWVDNGFRYAEGTLPCFKRDGCVFHHRKNYPAYATGGFDGAVNAVYMLSGTAFAISRESHQVLKDALLEMRFYCNKTSFPLAQSGRHPDGKGALIPRQYGLLALAGSPDGKDSIDRELAGAYLRLEGRNGKYSEIFNNEGIRPEAAPTGTHVYGYNSSLAHRQGEWLATVAGHSRYLWSAEIYQGANHYGRYLTHGSLQILADREPDIDSFGSGYAVDGWDWCHIPGTTAAVIPMEKMKANVLNVDEFSGYEEMLLSDEWFAGGVSHKGGSGAYAMKLHEHDKYNGSLRARKSFFLFGNRIIALGSDIENSLEGAPVHTTLFQNTASEEGTTILDGKALTGTVRVDSPLKEKTVVRDCFGNAYFVRNGKVLLSRQLQHSLHEETDKPTEGFYEKAAIGHDERNSYEYLLLVHPPEAQVAGYGEELPYRMNRCDSRVHSVTDLEEKTTACAVFEEGSVDSLVLNATPSMLMYSTDSEGLLTLSVSNPDLALYEGPSDEVFDKDGRRIERSVYGREWINNPCGRTSVRLTLDGEWDLESVVTRSAQGGPQTKIDRRTENGKTFIEVLTAEARTEEMTLRLRN